jgi:CRISPR-associated protein Cmr2
MRQWGQQFQRDFNQTELGRIIYAGGDDFLGIVYNSQFPDLQLDRSRSSSSLATNPL